MTVERTDTVTVTEEEEGGTHHREARSSGKEDGYYRAARAALDQFSAGVSFTQQFSTQSDLDWNGWNAYPQAVLNLKFC